MDPYQPPANEEKVLTTLTSFVPCPLAPPSIKCNYTMPQIQMSPVVYPSPYLQNPALLQMQTKMKQVRRTRLVFSREQTAVLESVYARVPNPDVDVRDNIANQLGVNAERIHTWFRNRRSRQRMAEKDKELRDTMRQQVLAEPELREYSVTPVDMPMTTQSQPTRLYSSQDMNTYMGQGVNLYHQYASTHASNAYVQNYYQNWANTVNHTQSNINRRYIPMPSPIQSPMKTFTQLNDVRVKQEVLSQAMDTATGETADVVAIPKNESGPSRNKASSSSSYT